MIPAVDKEDTELLLKKQRETIESIRQEILRWHLPKDQTEHDGEAQALCKLAVRGAQQARQWTGRMLHCLGTEYPYPNSQDATTQIIDKTAVPETTGLNLPEEYTVVQRIKHTRALLSDIEHELDELLRQCLLDTFFTRCLFQVQQHAIQTSMWLGELLHEFFAAQPKVEAEAPKNDFGQSTSSPTERPSTVTLTSGSDSEHIVLNFNENLPTDSGSTATLTEASLIPNTAAEAEAPGNDAAPTPSTSPSPTAMDSGLGAESSPALNFHEVEGAQLVPQSDASNSESSVSETSTSSLDQIGKSEFEPGEEAPVVSEKPKKSARNVSK